MVLAPCRAAVPHAVAVAHAVLAARIRFDRGLARANTAPIAPAMLPSDRAVIEAPVNGTGPVPAVRDKVGGGRADAAWWHWTQREGEGTRLNR